MSSLGSLVLLLSVGAALSSCPSSQWLPITDGGCYLPLVPPFTKMNADEAVRTCHFFGPDVTLPRADNPVSQGRIHLLAGGNAAWLALRRADNNSPWLWPDGAAAEYTRWGNGQPSKTDEHCVIMNSDGFWENARCNSPSYLAICYSPAL